MEQYIPKSALVTEIERKINEVNPDNIEDWRYRLQRERDIGVMKSILSLINALEVKEVNLEEEIDRELETRWKGEYLFISKFRESAKHFFELGIKAQKNEPVSEDLKKELSAYVNSKEYTNSTWSSSLLLIARHFANWQKKQKSIWHTMDESPKYPCDILFRTNVDNMFLYRYMENGRPVDRETPYFNNILNGKCWCYCSDIIND